MTRNIKALGLALVAMLAMGAVLASAASALTVTAAKYPAAITAVQTNTNTLSNGIRSVSCTEASLTGEIAAASEVIEIYPSYSGCTGNGNTTATVTLGTCVYTVKATEAHTATTGTAHVSIHCKEGHRIIVDIWATGKKHSEAKLCRLEVPAQENMTHAEYHNTEDGTIDLTLNITAIKILRTEGTAANCGAAEKTTGTYVGNVKASATSGGEAVNLMVG